VQVKHSPGCTGDTRALELFSIVNISPYAMADALLAEISCLIPGLATGSGARGLDAGRTQSLQARIRMQRGDTRRRPALRARKFTFQCQLGRCRKSIVTLRAAVAAMPFD